MELYEFTERIGKDTVFKYVIIMIFIYFVFRSRNIGLNVLLALFIGYVIVKYIDDKDRDKNLSNFVQQKEKKRIIVPNLPEDLLDKEDLVDFIFSIQDIYHYNPPEFENMIDSINSFMELHKIVMIDNTVADTYWNILEDMKRKSVNHLHNIIYSIEESKFVIDKLNRAHKRLETLLLNYLNEVYDEYNKKIVLKGYDIDTKLINLGPKPYNIDSVDSIDIKKNIYSNIYL